MLQAPFVTSTSCASSAGVPAATNGGAAGSVPVKQGDIILLRNAATGEWVGVNSSGTPITSSYLPANEEQVGTFRFQLIKFNTNVNGNGAPLDPSILAGETVTLKNVGTGAHLLFTQPHCGTTIPLFQSSFATASQLASTYGGAAPSAVTLHVLDQPDGAPVQTGQMFFMELGNQGCLLSTGPGNVGTAALVQPSTVLVAVSAPPPGASMQAAQLQQLQQMGAMNNGASNAQVANAVAANAASGSMLGSASGLPTVVGPLGAIAALSGASTIQQQQQQMQQQAAASEGLAWYWILLIVLLAVLVVVAIYYGVKAATESVKRTSSKSTVSMTASA